MKFLHARALLALAMPPLIGIAGCMENIALMRRPAIEEGQSDMRGEVESVDFSSRRIYFRPAAGDLREVSYTPDARVLYQGREYPISRLERGDIVALQLKRDTRGDTYADLIRLQENSRKPNSSERARGEASSNTARIQTLSGTVERVNVRGNSFELNDQRNQPISIVLSDYARDSDRERLRMLRDGDRVRIEGRFTGRDRFELLSFLNDES